MTAPTLQGNRQLRSNSIGLLQGVFQAMTHMGPAAGVASSLLVAVSFAGAAIPLSVLLAMAVCLCIAVAVGALARVYSTAGGIADYVSETLGDRAGTFIAWLYAPLELFIAPVVFMFFGQFLSGTLQASLGVSIPWWVFAVLSALLIAFLNVRDVKISTNAGVVLGSFELVIFLAFSIYVIFAGGSTNTFDVFNPAKALTPGLGGVFKGMVFSILAFQGFETAVPLAEETRDPLRTIPRTILYSALGVGVFYFVCSYAGVIGWGPNNMGTFATSDSPWISMAQKFWGPGWLLILFALINSFLGNANAGSTAASRIVYAFGRSGRLPRVFATTHPVHSTPTVAIYLQTVVSIVVALGLGLGFGPVVAFAVLGALITVFAIFIYMGACVATIRLYTTVRRYELKPVKHIVIPAIAIAMLLAPLYYQFVPWPDYPGNWGNIAAIVFLAAALLGAALTRPRGKTERAAVDSELESESSAILAGREEM
jgi:amino acid transporter